MRIQFDEKYFMAKAIDEAKIALSMGEVPIGAVIVADGVCDSIVLVFLENSRNKNLRSKNWINRQEKKIFEGIEYLSNHLKEKEFFVGNNFSIADISCFSCLEYIDLRFPKFDWRKRHKNLDKYWKTHEIRDSFQKTKPKAQMIEPIQN